MKIIITSNAYKEGMIFMIARRIHSVSRLLKRSNNREWWIFIYSASLLPFHHTAGIILNRKWAKRSPLVHVYRVLNSFLNCRVRTSARARNEILFSPDKYFSTTPSAHDENIIILNLLRESRCLDKLKRASNIFQELKATLNRWRGGMGQGVEGERRPINNRSQVLPLFSTFY